MCLVDCRNAALARSGMKMPTPVKTGTTIAGLVFKVRDFQWQHTLLSSLLSPRDVCRMESFSEQTHVLLRCVPIVCVCVCVCVCVFE